MNIYSSYTISKVIIILLHPTHLKRKNNEAGPKIWLGGIIHKIDLIAKKVKIYEEKNMRLNNILNLIFNIN